MKRELVFSLKGSRADLNKELHLQGKLEKRGKNTKVKERLPSTQESNKLSWQGGKKSPIQTLQLSFSLKKGNLTRKCWREWKNQQSRLRWGHIRKNSLFHGIKRLKLSKKEMLLSAFQG